MHIREEARKQGGDALVAKLDKGLALEKELLAALEKLQVEAMDKANEGADEDGKHINLMALCEAMARGYAVAVVSAQSHPKCSLDRGEMMVLAIRSFSNKLTSLFETHDLKKTGIEDLISAAAKRGGQK